MHALQQDWSQPFSSVNVLQTQEAFSQQAGTEISWVFVCRKISNDVKKELSLHGHFVAFSLHLCWERQCQQAFSYGETTMHSSFVWNNTRAKGEFVMQEQTVHRGFSNLNNAAVCWWKITHWKIKANNAARCLKHSRLKQTSCAVAEAKFESAYSKTAHNSNCFLSPQCKKISNSKN